MKTSKQELEECLKKVWHDKKRLEHIVIPPKIPYTEPLQFNLDTGSQKRKVENTVRWPRAASAPGPNGVPCKLYKKALDILHCLPSKCRGENLFQYSSTQAVHLSEKAHAKTSVQIQETWVPLVAWRKVFIQHQIDA